LGNASLSVADIDKDEWAQVMRRVGSRLSDDAEPRAAHRVLCEEVLDHRRYRSLIRTQARLLAGDEAFAEAATERHVRRLKQDLAERGGTADENERWAQLESRFALPRQQFTSDDLRWLLASVSAGDDTDVVLQAFSQLCARVAQKWHVVQEGLMPSPSTVLLALTRTDALASGRSLVDVTEVVLAEQVLPPLIEACRGGSSAANGRLRILCEHSVRSVLVHVTGLDETSGELTRLTTETLEDMVNLEPVVRNMADVRQLASTKARAWSRSLSAGGNDSEALLDHYWPRLTHLGDAQRAYAETAGLRPTDDRLKRHSVEELKRLIHGGETLRQSRAGSKGPRAERSVAALVSEAAAIGVWRPALDALLPYLSDEQEAHRRDDAARALELCFLHAGYLSALRALPARRAVRSEDQRPGPLMMESRKGGMSPGDDRTPRERVGQLREPRAQQAADDALAAAVQILERPFEDLGRRVKRIAVSVEAPLLEAVAVQPRRSARLPRVDEALRLALTWPCDDRRFAQCLLTGSERLRRDPHEALVGLLDEAVRNSGAPLWQTVVELLHAADQPRIPLPGEPLRRWQGLVPISVTEGMHVARMLRDVQGRARSAMLALYDVTIHSALQKAESDGQLIVPGNAMSCIASEIAKSLDRRRAKGLSEGNALAGIRKLAYTEADLHREVESAVRRFIHLSTVRPLRRSIGTDEPSGVLLRQVVSALVKDDSVDMVASLLVEHIRVPVSNLGTYIRRSSFNGVRRQARLAECRPEDGDGSAVDKTVFVGRPTRWQKLLIRAARRLGKGQRRVLLRAWWLQESFTTIGERSGVSSEVVRRRYSRAQRALVNELEREDAIYFLVALQDGEIDDGATALAEALPRIRSGALDLRRTMNKVLKNVAKDLSVFERHSLNQANFPDWLQAHGDDVAARPRWNHDKWTLPNAGHELVARARRVRASQRLSDEVRREEDVLLTQAAATVAPICDDLAAGGA